MNTMFDFITHVKGIEYLLAVSAIVVYLVYWEFLKPRPFRTVVEEGKADLEYVREKGEFGKTAGKIAAAPFIGLAYIIILPFTFLYAVVLAVTGSVGRKAGEGVAFDWRPSEAYLSGKKDDDDKKTDKK